MSIAPYIQSLLLLNYLRLLLLIAGQLLSINYKMNKYPGVLLALTAFVHIHIGWVSYLYRQR